MRMARGGEFRRKIIEVSTKIVMIFITVLFCLWMISGARAADAVRITGVKHSNDSGLREVAIELSETIASERISVEHQRNFIQVSIRGASAFPAQTTSVNDGLMDKVFTYQYQPDLARARILLNTESKKFAESTEWSITGNSLIVKFGAARDQVTTKKAALSRDSIQEADARIVKEILAGKKEAATEAATPTPIPAKNQNIEDEPLFTGKTIGGKKEKPAETTTQSAARVVSALLTVLLLMGGAFLGYRKLRGIKGGKNAGSARAMETVLSHNLGGKRALSLVRIAGKYYVLGVTDHNISVITSFDNDNDIEKYIDEITSGGGFESMLAGKLNIFARKEQAEQAWEQDGGEAAKPAERTSVRDVIKKRIEGFKPLY